MTWLILIIAILVIGIVTLSYILISLARNFLQTRVPFAPTKKVDIAAMIERVGIKPVDFVLDIGSGNGKVLFEIEKLVGARTRGIQRAGWPQNYAKLRKLISGSKIELVSDDFFNQPWREASVVYAYLFPPLMRSVGEKFLADCHPATKLICRDFDIPQLQPVEVWTTPSNHKMYLYIR